MMAYVDEFGKTYPILHLSLSPPKKEINPESKINRNTKI